MDIASTRLALGSDLASVSEHLMFAIIPVGVAILATPLYGKSSLPPLAPDFHSKSCSWVSTAMLSCQTLAVVLRAYSPPNSDISLTAAALSLLASASATIVLRSRYAFQFRPATLPLFLVMATLIYDAAISRQYFLSRSWMAAKVQFTLLLLKFTFIVLGYRAARRFLRTPPVSHDLNSFWLHARSLFIPVSRRSQSFSTADMSDDTGLEDPRSVFRRFAHHWRRANQRSNMALLKSCGRTLITQCIAVSLAQGCLVLFILSQPLLLQFVVKIVEKKDTSYATAVNAIGATVMVHLGIITSRNVLHTFRARILTSIRSILITAIHEKMLLVSSNHLNNYFAEKLLFSEVEDVVAYVGRLQDQLMGTFAIVVGCALLYHLMGFAFLALALPVPFWILLSVQNSKVEVERLHFYRRQSAARINTISDIILQLRNVKMMGLGNVLSQYVERKAYDEVEARKHWRHSHNSLISLSAFRQTMNPALVLAMGVFWTQTLSLADVATVFASFTMALQVADFLVQAQYFFLHCRTGCPASRTIQSFLLLPDLSVSHGSSSSSVSDIRENHIGAAVAIELRDVTVALKGDTIFEDMSLEIQEGKVSMVIGPVGCGKSTLLKLLLREVEPTAGIILAKTMSKALCGQDAWLPSVTVRQLVVGVHGYQEEWYRNVLMILFLDSDVLSWPDGDNTSVSLLSPNLTKSQKQRLALARALYARPSLLVLDDTLCDIDLPKSSAILERLFGENGLTRRWNCTSVVVTSTYNHLRFCDTILEIKEDGQLWEHVDVRRFLETTPVATYLSIRPSATSPELETEPSSTFAAPQNDAGHPKPFSELAFPDLSHIWDIISYLLRHAGRWSIFFGPVVCGIAALVEVLPPIVLAYTYQAALSDPKYFACYFAFGLLNLFTNWAACSYIFVAIFSKSAEAIHRDTIRVLLRATPAYIAKTDPYYLVTLFGNDLGVISSEAQSTLLQSPWFVFTVLFYTAAIVPAVHLGVLLAPIVAIFLYAAQHVYSQLSAQLRVLKTQDLDNLQAHLAETVAGIEHIRSFAQQPQSVDKMLSILYASRKLSYYDFKANGNLAACCDALCGLIAIVVVALASLWPENVSCPGFALSLLSISTFSEILHGAIRISVNLQDYLGTVCRIRKFCQDTPQEQYPSTAPSVPDSWLPTGQLEFRQATSKSEGAASLPGHALKDATFAVEAGEKAGLGGYPYDGQSSVIFVVLRMVDYTGSIRIDGREVKSIPHEILRASITTITEDGIAFSGSVRINLDPYSITEDRFTDADLISMLTRVGLWQIVSRRGGLDADISHMHFSLGHLQLLNLARGALHKRRAGTRIVLIDEATSRLDVDTEFQMSDFMDGEFAGATVLIVAQRLQCFETADVVLMMREGRVDSILRQDEDTGEWYEDFDREDGGAVQV